jgi:hypothetical protein
LRLLAAGAKNSMDATVCETDEVSLRTWKQDSVCHNIFSTENGSEIVVMEPEDDTNERQCFSKCQCRLLLLKCRHLSMIIKARIENYRSMNYSVTHIRNHSRVSSKYFLGPSVFKHFQCIYTSIDCKSHL